MTTGKKRIQRVVLVLFELPKTMKIVIKSNKALKMNHTTFSFPGPLPDKNHYLFFFSPAKTAYIFVGSIIKYWLGK